MFKASSCKSIYSVSESRRMAAQQNTRSQPLLESFVPVTVHTTVCNGETSNVDDCVDENELAAKTLSILSRTLPASSQSSGPTASLSNSAGSAFRPLLTTPANGECDQDEDSCAHVRTMICSLPSGLRFGCPFTLRLYYIYSFTFSLQSKPFCFLNFAAPTKSLFL